MVEPHYTARVSSTQKINEIKDEGLPPEELMDQI